MHHLRTLKTINLVWGAFLALLAAIFGLGFVVVGILALTQGEGGGGLFIVYGLVTLAILGGLAWMHFYAGWMVTAGRARNLQTSLAVLQLGNFPIGTAYAGYALWVCHFNPQTSAVFDRPHGRRVS
jgi:hypothetical protein